MRSERGGILLEVLVALTILAVAGVALAQAVGEHVRAYAQARERESELRGADEALTRLALRGARSLDLRLGRRDVGDFVTEVVRPRPGLYRLSVRSRARPEDELLVTAVFRPEGS